MNAGEWLVQEGKALAFNAEQAKLTVDEDLPDVDAVEFGGTPQARINYLSVSQLKTAALCRRKWWFSKVKGMKEPEKGNQALGKEVHKQLEHYELYNEDVLGDIARAALPYLPKPDPSRLCEESITASNRPITGPLVTVDGLPLVGFVDRIDEGARPRAVDYKTSSNPEKYAATAADLSRTDNGAGIQMVGYALAVWKMLGLHPDEPIELEHLYLHTKPTKADIAAKRDAKQVIGSITPRAARVEWIARMDPLARELREVAKAPTLDDVPPSWEACGAFGGCHFSATCLINETRSKQPKPEVTHMSLKDLLAKRNAPLQPKPETFVAPAADPTPLEAQKALAEASEPLPQVVPPDAPKSDPAKAAEPFAEEKPSASMDAAKKGRKKREPLDPVAIKAALGGPLKPEEAKGELTPVSLWEPGPCAMFEGPTTTTPPLEIFVDCVSSKPAAPLAPYIAEKLELMAAPFPGLIDVRCAPKKNAEGKDHPYAFGGWKGVLAAECRLNPPAPGRYFALGVTQSEIAQVVCEALEPLCAEFTKGVR